MEALLQGGADPNLETENLVTPLMAAALLGPADSVAALLAAGANPAATNKHGRTVLHCAASAAAGDADTAIVRQILAAAPGTALVGDGDGETPLQNALSASRFQTAACLLAEGPLPPAPKLLATLNRRANQQAVLLLYAIVAARLPMSAEEWALIPEACPGLGSALPAVLERFAAEASGLVMRLPAEERERLKAAALCLARAQELVLQGRTLLPTPITWRILALALT